MLDEHTTVKASLVSLKTLASESEAVVVKELKAILSS